MKTLHHAGAISKHRASTLSPLPPLRDLVASIDLSALVEKYAGACLRNGSRGYLFRCPNPSHPDTSPSFSVFTGAGGVQRCHCLSSCGHIGDALAFLKWLNNCDTKTAAQELRSFAGAAPLPKHDYARTQSKPRELVATAPSGLVEDDEAMASYLASRGWPASVVETFSLQVMRDGHGIKRARHPFYSWIDGELLETGWQARRLDNSQELRWLGAKDTPLPLYNLAALDSDEITTAIICEGAADTITAHLATAHLDAYACVGVAGAMSWREEWAQFFTGLRVIVATDNDAAGEKLLEKICNSLAGVALELIAACPTTNDLSDMAKSEGLEAVTLLLTSWHEDEKHAPRLHLSDAVTKAGAEVQTLARCKVCAKEVQDAARFCKACLRSEALSGIRWKVCDTCNTFALVANNRGCHITYACIGSFVEAVRS